MGVAIHWETAGYILSHLLYLNVEPMFFMGLSVFEVRLDESQFSPCLMMNGALHQDSSLMENNIWLNTDLLVVHLLHYARGATVPALQKAGCLPHPCYTYSRQPL